MNFDTYILQVNTYVPAHSSVVASTAAAYTGLLLCSDDTLPTSNI